MFFLINLFCFFQTQTRFWNQLWWQSYQIVVNISWKMKDQRCQLKCCFPNYLQRCKNIWKIPEDCWDLPLCIRPCFSKQIALKLMGKDYWCWRSFQRIIFQVFISFYKTFAILIWRFVSKIGQFSWIWKLGTSAFSTF